MSKQFSHQQIDEIVHSRIRLAILVNLAMVDETDFISLLKSVDTTKGNLSVHLSKLEENGCVKITKKFEGKKPVTLCSITAGGSAALEQYLAMVEELAGLTSKKLKGSK